MRQPSPRAHASPLVTMFEGMLHYLCHPHCRVLGYSPLPYLLGLEDMEWLTTTAGTGANTLTWLRCLAAKHQTFDSLERLGCGLKRMGAAYTSFRRRRLRAEAGAQASPRRAQPTPARRRPGTFTLTFMPPSTPPTEAVSVPPPAVPTTPEPSITASPSTTPLPRPAFAHHHHHHHHHPRIADSQLDREKGSACAKGGDTCKQDTIDLQMANFMKSQKGGENTTKHTIKLVNARRVVLDLETNSKLTKQENADVLSTFELEEENRQAAFVKDHNQDGLFQQEDLGFLLMMKKAMVEVRAEEPQILAKFRELQEVKERVASEAKGLAITQKNDDLERGLIQIGLMREEEVIAERAEAEGENEGVADEGQTAEKDSSRNQASTQAGTSAEELEEEVQADKGDGQKAAEEQPQPPQQQQQQQQTPQPQAGTGPGAVLEHIEHEDVARESEEEVGKEEEEGGRRTAQAATGA